MAYTSLISADQLQQLLAAGESPLLLDCSFDLMTPSAGRVAYEAAHIPGAQHADLDHDLSADGSNDAASGGRHPLPSRATFSARLSAWGLNPGQQVVVYDRQGVTFAARAWWMLKWCGHNEVAVLDGGFAAWQAGGGDVETGTAAASTQGRFTLGESHVQVRGARDVLRHLGSGGQTVLDARAAARYRGETEPLDPVAGHIPGALNRPFTDNLLPDGRLKPADKLREEFLALLAGRDPATVVHQCGSGVTAIPNLLAMEVAGLGQTALFPGSWSEWCNTPGMPCARH